jgi:hypothetical protein
MAVREFDLAGRPEIEMPASRALLPTAVLVCPATSALGRDNGLHRGNPPVAQSLIHPDNPYVSCCGDADAFEADEFVDDLNGNYIAIITDGRGSATAREECVIRKTRAVKHYTDERAGRRR